MEKAIQLPLLAVTGTNRGLTAVVAGLNTKRGPFGPPTPPPGVERVLRLRAPSAGQQKNKKKYVQPIPELKLRNSRFKHKQKSACTQNIQLVYTSPIPRFKVKLVAPVTVLQVVTNPHTVPTQSPHSPHTEVLT